MNIFNPSEREIAKTVCNLPKVGRLLALVIIGEICCSCATEHLADRTESVGSSAIDIYYSQVLDNIARQKDVPDSLPWAMELTSATIAVNDTASLTGGYSEVTQNVTPSASLMGSRAIQQSWGVAPVTNQGALLQLKGWYYKASYNKKIDNLTNTGSETVTRTAVMSYTNSTSAVPPNDSTYKPPLPSGPVGKDAKATVVNTITNSAATVSQSKYASQSIDTTCFKFCRPVDVPSNTYHASHGSWAVYVKKDCDKDMNEFTRFTLLVMGEIDQIPPKATAVTPGVGTSQPLPLLQ